MLILEKKSFITVGMNKSLFISGMWRDGRGEPFTSKNPATGETLWEGAEATQEDIAESVLAARAAFPAWSRLSFPKRLSYLNDYGTSLKKKKKELAEAISQETGKPLWESVQEIESMLAKIEISIDAIQVRCPDVQIAADLYTHHKPHGVIAIFGPFNFPGHLPNGHLVPALLAGNTIVFKSSPLTPKVSSLIVECLSHLPEGVISLVQGGAKTGHHLATHPQIDGLFFTGSFHTGSLLLETLGRHPEKILALEMGGNNPLIVSDTPDLEAAAYLTIQSAYLTSGQRCSCARRLILLEGKTSEEFLKVLTHMTSSIQVGSYLSQPEPFMGPVINQESADRLLNAQATYGAEGGKCLVEMCRLKGELPFLSPGLMDVTEVSHRKDEELFGPFLQVIRVPNFEAALHEANQTAFGLTAALVSGSREKFEQFFHTVRAGVLNWNYPTTGASSRAPFGGVGKSGNFRPSGYYAASYCSYPIASMERELLLLPKEVAPGITLLAKT